MHFFDNSLKFKDFFNICSFPQEFFISALHGARWSFKISAQTNAIACLEIKIMQGMGMGLIYDRDILNFELQKKMDLSGSMIIQIIAKYISLLLHPVLVHFSDFLSFLRPSLFSFTNFPQHFWSFWNN